MYVENVKQLIGEVITCAAEFESLVSRLYSEVAVRTENLAVSLGLRFLSLQSDSHSELLRLLVSELRYTTAVGDCKKLVGIPWTTAEEVLAEVTKYDRIDNSTLSEKLRKLEVVESFIGEETYHRILLNLLKDVLYASEDLGSVVGMDLILSILDEISREEEFHEKLLIEIVKALETGE